MLLLVVLLLMLRFQFVQFSLQKNEYVKKIAFYGFFFGCCCFLLHCKAIGMQQCSSVIVGFLFSSLYFRFFNTQTRQGLNNCNGSMAVIIKIIVYLAR